MGTKIKKILPLIYLSFLVFFVYWQFFLLGKIPMPADLMTGVYYPWLDYKWGYTTGVPVINPSISDIFSQFFPWKYLVIEMFKDGIIPLWNQYSFSGTPLLENYHTGVFLPFNLILFLPKYFGWGIFIFGQTLFAAIGMYLLLKFYVTNNKAKIVGALVFSLSGLMTTWVEFGTGVWAAAMMPWIFYFINLFVENHKVRNLFFLTLIYSSLILAGHAQLTVFSSLLIGIYLIYLCFFKKILSIKDLVIIIFFVILGIGISTIELIPVYNQVFISIRSSEKSYIKELNNGLTPWYDFIRLYIPDFFGNPSTYNYWGDVSYYENSPFLGTLILPFSIPFFFKRFRKKQISFWFMIFVFTFFFASLNPLTSFFYNLKLPFLTYSSASRIFFITSFCAAILIAEGIELFAKNKSYRKAVLFSSIFLFLVAILALLKLKLDNIESVDFKVSLKNTIIPVGFLCILMSSFLIKTKNKLILILITILIFFDLFRYFNKFNPFVNKNLIFPKTPAIEFLEKDPGIFRIGRLNREIMTPNSWIPYHLSSIEGYDPMALVNYSRFFNRVNNGFYFNNISRFSEMYNEIDFKFISALNVKYLLSVENSTKKVSPLVKINNLEEVFRDKSAVIYKNPNYKERFYFVSNVIKVSNIKEMADILDKKDFNPTLDAIVVGEDLNTNNIGSGDVKINLYKANSIKLTTENKKDGFLVISDTYHPGWRVFIDDKPAKLFEVNGALRGILIPEGHHQITMEYWPKSFDIGIKVSITCLVVLLILVFVFIHKKIW